MIDRFLTLEEEGALKNDLSALPDRLALLREVRTRCNSGEKCQLAELLKRLNIHYQIRNAAQSGLPPQSVDLIVSDVVLEYISLERLSEIFHEFRRIAAAEAVMSHSISLDDQYSHFDRRISQFNFLRFSDRLWSWLNNPIIPLNRLRISDYRRLFNETGFQIVDEMSRRGDPAELARVPLAERFRGYPIDDLLVTYTRLAAVARISS